MGQICVCFVVTPVRYEVGQFVFPVCFSKDSAWKTEFFAYYISRKQSADQQKQQQNNAFHVKTRQSAKNQLDPARNENQPKK